MQPSFALESPPSGPLLHAEVKSRVQAFYDELGDGRDDWIARSRYYYDTIRHLLRLIVPRGSRVLSIGCGSGEHLAALEPSLGVGVDISGWGAIDCEAGDSEPGGGEASGGEPGHGRA